MADNTVADVTLSEHNSDTSEYTIYSRYGGAIVLYGKAEFAEYMRLEGGIRAAERLAFKHAEQRLAWDIEAFLTRRAKRDP